MEFYKYLDKNKNNLIFLIPTKPLRKILFVSYKSSEDPEFIVPFRIKEDFYKIMDNYKIELIPITKEYKETFGKETFYISDLENLIKEDIVKMYIKIKEI